MLPSTNIQSIVGATLFGADDKKIGRITQVFVDAADGHPTFAEVHTGFLGRAVRHVPLDDARWENDDIFVDFTEDDVKHSPHHDGAEGLSPEQESDLRRHYFPSAGAAGATAAAAGQGDGDDQANLGTRDASDVSPVDARRVALGEELPGGRARNAVAPGSYTDRDDAEVLDRAAVERHEHEHDRDLDDHDGLGRNHDGLGRNHDGLGRDRDHDGLGDDRDHDHDGVRNDGLGRGDGGSVGVAGDPLHERDRRVRDDLDAVPPSEPLTAEHGTRTAGGTGSAEHAADPAEAAHPDTLPEPPARHAAPPTGDIPRI